MENKNNMTEFPISFIVEDKGFVIHLSKFCEVEVNGEVIRYDRISFTSAYWPQLFYGNPSEGYFRRIDNLEVEDNVVSSIVSYVKYCMEEGLVTQMRFGQMCLFRLYQKRIVVSCDDLLFLLLGADSGGRNYEKAVANISEEINRAIGI
jgi:hypothetical protein